MGGAVARVAVVIVVVVKHRSQGEQPSRLPVSVQSEEIHVVEVARLLVLLLASPDFSL